MVHASIVAGNLPLSTKVLWPTVRASAVRACPGWPCAIGGKERAGETRIPKGDGGQPASLRFQLNSRTAAEWVNSPTVLHSMPPKSGKEWMPPFEPAREQEGLDGIPKPMRPKLSAWQLD